MGPEPVDGSNDDGVDGVDFSAGPVRFEAHAFSLTRKGRAGPLIPYAEVTHCARSRWGYAIATTRNVFFLRGSRFASEEQVAGVDLELRARIGCLPEGEIQLKRIAELDARPNRRGQNLVVYGFIVLCLAAQFLQFQEPAVVHAGSFMPALVAQGEFWRVLIANFLHDTLIFPFHILLNMMCIFAFGVLVERSMGRGRTALIMGVSALGAMWAASVAGYPEVIGASGVASGLVGSTLCLELNASRCLPVWSRIPRRVFVLAVLAQALVDLAVPFVAGAAHLGGFLLGYMATRCLIDEGRIRASGGMARGLTALMTLALVASLVAMLPLLRRDPVALEKHGIRVLQMPEPLVRFDNEAAWRMLTESKPTEAGLEVAVLLGLRAARYSDWQDPNVLDTLAEGLFASGDFQGALEIIDQAIFLSHGHRYFIEQRQRFTGERDPEDRPEPPEQGWFLRQPGSSEGFPPPEPAIEPAEPGESAWI
ncbi:MAG TPA: rhomboid family intramembrane serine protease [Myxococcales bacterium]|nr:rhomboid family intramembrane serine protease [Myxococcales bacterium]HIL00917.1 rhomboid family intramembrane serine protease [Myxococcales bacterium]